MKICYTIAEYNPFHNGHQKHVDYMRKVLGADKIVVISSGNFTQRGEPAILNKFVRAKTAVMGGVDLVIELPTVFATANAETFAKGAVNLIASLNVPGTLCFGIESGEKQDYISLATAMNDESKEFKSALKKYLDDGVSLAQAKFMAVKETGKEFDEKLISSPNNILGLEYVKAVLSTGAKLEIEPMIREGDHNDKTFKKGVTSATSIREILKIGKAKKLKNALPKFTFNELKVHPQGFDKLILAEIIRTDAKTLSKVPDCTEGLENRIKALVKDSKSVNELVDKVSTKRYTATRIHRILTSNLLGIEDRFVKECLKEELYAKVLAVKESSKDLISLMNEKSLVPVLTRKSDLMKLKKTAEKCFEIDVLANDLHNLVMNEKTNENYMVIV